MKASFLWSLSFGVLIALAPFVGGCVETTQATESAIAVSDDETAATGADAAIGIETAPVSEIAEPTAGPVSNEKPLPPNVRATGAVADVIRLADSGVDQSVMLAFVTNSTGTFNLGAEEIIYL